MTINIPLDRDWCVQTDERNYILCKKSGARWLHQGFYITLADAVNEYLERKIRLCDAQSIHELVQYIKSVQTSLNKVLQPLNLEAVPLKTGGAK